MFIRGVRLVRGEVLSVEVSTTIPLEAESVDSPESAVIGKNLADAELADAEEIELTILESMLDVSN